MRFCFQIFLLILSTQLLLGQNQDVTSTNRTLVPVIFYLPETSLGFGGMVISNIKFLNHEEGTRPSQFIFSNAYTLKKQFLLFAPFEFYSNKNLYRIKGELGYYHYFYNYFGIGRSSRFENLETYNVRFPRLNIDISRMVLDKFYLGAGLAFDAYNITAIEEGGLLMTDRPIGYQGGRKSNGYLLAAFDSRDNINAPSNGYYLETSILRSLSSPLSDFRYTKWVMDLRSYSTLWNKWVMASQIFVAVASENTPFFDLPYLSTPILARGLNDRRYLSSRIAATQNEFRFRLKNRFHAATFLSLNFLLDQNWDLFQEETLVITYGIGLRYEIQPETRTRLRLDFALGDGSFNFYFTVNEAF